MAATLVSTKAKRFLSFNWTDSTSLWLAKQDPFGCAMVDHLDEGRVGLSREQSSTSERLMFSNSDELAESGDGGMTTKKVCCEEEDFVPCSLNDFDVELCPHDNSPQGDRVDFTKELNRSGCPVPAASLRIGQDLVAARAAAASRACVEAGPRAARTDRQRRALSQTAMRRAMTDVEPYNRNDAVPQCATQPAPLTSASVLLRKYVADFENLPLSFVKCKDRNMSSLDRAVARVLTGQIRMAQVNRHHVSKSSVKKRMTRLKNGLATPGRKPTLIRSVDEAIVTYVDDNTNAGMARYRDEIWDKAEQLAREAKMNRFLLLVASFQASVPHGCAANERGYQTRAVASRKFRVC